MGARGSPEYQARQRERERQRRQQAQRKRAEEASSNRSGVEVDGRVRRAAAMTCGWCGGAITLRSRGPIPKWCSATCRHRAWEQARATASTQAAVRVVERQVEIRVPLPPTRRDWPSLLGELAAQVDDGRVYDRDLPSLARALQPVLQAYQRRAHRTGGPDLR